MARLIAALIRHGDYHQLPNTPSAHQPFPLNPLGEEQARAGAERLKADVGTRGWKPVPLVDSSQMLRGWQTARLFAAALGNLQVESFDALAERGLGCAANLSVRQVEEIIRSDPRYPPPPADWKANSRYCLPLQGAESLLQAGERVAGHLQARMAELARLPTDTDRLKLFVGHGAAFRHAAHHLGIMSFGQIARLSMYHASPVYLEYLSDGSWRHIGGEWKVRKAAEQAMD